ncbi:hypothetical protein L484_026002 [Morus notabilis]|uniref:Uncharacterized protein n=1 Tax=Morus notabilis TaxID=981085 RepID=W9RI88_9ROSA|nr:hypothetical protein L484_026002 [Morus notabilis]
MGALWGHRGSPGVEVREYPLQGSHAGIDFDTTPVVADGGTVRGHSSQRGGSLLGEPQGAHFHAREAFKFFFLRMISVRRDSN